jgi:hypothetical protein
MTKLLGCAAAALIFAAAFVSVLPVDSGTSGRTPALWDTPEAISVEVERSQQLDDALATNVRIREERFRIVNELDAGSIKLDEAVAQFLPLNEVDSVTWQFLTTQYPQHKPEELVGYQLMIAAFARPEPVAGKNLKLMQRLHTLLKERFGDRVLMPPHLADRLVERAANP